MCSLYFPRWPGRLWDECSPAHSAAPAAKRSALWPGGFQIPQSCGGLSPAKSDRLAVFQRDGSEVKPVPSESLGKLEARRARTELACSPLTQWKPHIRQSNVRDAGIMEEQPLSPAEGVYKGDWKSSSHRQSQHRDPRFKKNHLPTCLLSSCPTPTEEWALFGFSATLLGHCYCLHLGSFCTRIDECLSGQEMAT